MIYETADQYESRTMPEAFLQVPHGRKRKSEPPTWVLHQQAIADLQKQYGMKRFLELEEEYQQKKANWQEED